MRKRFTAASLHTVLAGGCTYWRLAHRTPRKFLTGGGDADVEKETHLSTDFHRNNSADDDSTDHKSVLAVRLDPERLAV